MQTFSLKLNQTLLAACVVFVTPSALADDYSALFKAKKYDEIAKLSTAKLSTDVNNAEALIAKARLILAEGKESHLDEAVKLSEQCITAHPDHSECQESLGNVLGTKAMMGGIMSAIGYATKIRDAFKKAVELNPKNVSARDGLLQYYLQAPGIVGGGKGKAENLVAETAKIHPAAATLFQAKLDMGDDKFSKAETASLSVNTAGSEELSNIQRGILQNLGFAYAKDKKFADASRIFQDMQQRFPDSDAGAYGMARVLQEQGKHKEAIGFFEKALSVEARANTYYRIAQSWQALSDKVKAIAAFEKALSIKPELFKKFKTDAETQIKALRG